MGMDFVALLKYGGPETHLLNVLDRLEVESPEEVRAVGQLPYFLGEQEPPVWRVLDGSYLRNPRLDHRPHLPTITAALHLPEGFVLTFGPDTIEVYSPVRWRIFLTQSPLQQTMLDACRCLGHLFGATDCVLTSDYSPLVHATRTGQSFAAALAAAGPEEGERPNLADLYQEIPADQVYRLVKGTNDRPPRCHYQTWAPHLPPPEGWQRVTNWDSHGYWRFSLGAAASCPGVVSFLARPVLPAATRFQNAPRTLPAEEWRLNDNPDVMLEQVLKHQKVSWRKVQLWGCACLRRIWPHLVLEPSRRPVEVVERFADGQATLETVEKAQRGSSGVKKHLRRASDIAGDLARLCGARPRFRPGIISESILRVVAEAQPGTSLMEKQAHADLLRDIFGPQPLPPVSLAPSWQTPTVLALAQAAYDERELPSGYLDVGRLAILADALEEAGCENTEMLEHLRSPGPHTRGCWVVDALLGKS